MLDKMLRFKDKLMKRELKRKLEKNKKRRKNRID